jgi:hypothetical protein
MRVISWLASAALLAAAIPLLLAARPLPAFADDTVTTCPNFTSVKWVNVMDPSESGNLYAVSINTNAMSCADATKWAKKLIPTHIGGAMGSMSELKGGPPGYHCAGVPDHNGIAYGGHCTKPGMGAVPGFTWRNTSP